MSSKNKRYIKRSTIYPEYQQRNVSSIDNDILKLNLEKNILIKSDLESSDPDRIIKAYDYINNIGKKDSDTVKSLIFAPEGEINAGNGYRVPTTVLSDDMMRRMARTPIMSSIIKTRVDQIASYCNWTQDESRIGWTIRVKPGRFDQYEMKSLSRTEMREIDFLAKFIENCGSNDNRYSNDNFESFLRRVSHDTLELDKLSGEISFNRMGLPSEFMAVDGGTIRLSDTSNIKDGIGFGPKYINTKAVKGYLPSHVQIWKNLIVNTYYPWQMMWGVRNTTTDLWMNGYGYSELEVLINVVTWQLFAQQYNGLFFSQGSNPKGFFVVEGNLDPGKLREFQQMWRNTSSGISGAHKIPVFDGSSKVNWIDMQMKNAEMQFQEWLDYLTGLACAVFRIDPTEVGLGAPKSQALFGNDNTESRIEYSKSKGLYPILRFIEHKINKYLIEPFYSKKYEFKFCGIDAEDIDTVIAQDIKKVDKGLMSLQDVFRKYNLRDLNVDKDIILNPQYIQWVTYKEQKMAETGMNPTTATPDGSQKKLDQSVEDNPFAKYEMEKSYKEFEKGMDLWDLNHLFKMIGK